MRANCAAMLGICWLMAATIGVSVGQDTDQPSENDPLIQEIIRHNRELLGTRPLRAVVEYHEVSGGEKGPVTRVEYWRTDDGLLALISKDSRKTALGFNSEYGFVVERESDDRAWALRNILPPREILTKLQGHLSNVLVTAYIEFQPLFTLIPGDTKQYTTSLAEGEVLLEIHEAAKSDRPRFVRSGKIWLDRNASYAVNRFDLEIVSPVDSARVSGECFYGDQDAKGRLMPLGRSLRYYDGSEDPTPVEIHTKVKRFELVPSAPERFRISAFGLPEPELPGMSPQIVVVVTAGFLLVVVGTIVSQRDNKRDAHAQASVDAKDVG